jgi:hypothetical protein
MPAPPTHPLHHFCEHRSKHAPEFRNKKACQQSTFLVEKTRLAKMAPLRLVPNPDRPLVANANLDSFIHHFGVVVD